MRLFLAVLAVFALLACKDEKAAETSGTSEGSNKVQVNWVKATGPGIEKLDALVARVEYTVTDLSVDGTSLGTLTDGGLIEPGLLDHLLRQLEPAVTSSDPVGISLDPGLAYARVGALLNELKNAGITNIALLTGLAKGKTGVPVKLGDPAASGLRPMITVKGGRIVLWSLSGEEGTLQQPKAVFAANASSYAPLTKELVELVRRRWPNGNRTAIDRTITLQIEPAASAEVLVKLAAAIRGDSQSLLLFTTIFLAGGA